MDTTDSESDSYSDVILDEEQLTDSDSEYETDDENEAIDIVTEQSESQPPSVCQELPNKKRKRQIDESSSSSETRSATGPDHTAPKHKPAGNKDILLDLFENLVRNLTSCGASFADFLLFVFNPKRRGDTKDLRHKHFWAHKKKVKKLLKCWSHSHQSDPGRHLFLEWIHDYVGRELRAEARKVTTTGVLHTTEERIEPEYLRNNFKISSITETVARSCPLTIQMMLDFTTPKGARKKLSELSRAGQTAIMSAATVLLRQHSRRNNLFQTHLALYMFGIGLQRQGYDILSHLGTLTSYSNLIRGMSDPDSTNPKSKSHKPQKKKKANSQSQVSATTSKAPSKAPSKQSNGAVKMLSHGCRKLTKRRWKERRHGIIFDNFNFVLKAAQQTLGRTDSQENGTCATIFELHKATPEALDHSAARAAFIQAQPLQQDHVLHGQTERETHRKLMIHGIVRVILKYGGEEFKQYGPLLDESQPIVLLVVDVHTSNFYPLPAMDIDESSIDGVIKVFEAIFKELEIDTNAEEFVRDMILVAGDLKSGLNLNGAQDSRIGQEEPKSSFSNLEYILGLFHTKMTAVVSILNTHLGSPTAGRDAPGSLFFHNSILERKAFVATSLPSFAVAKDLIMDSLAARIIHCLLRVSNCKNLESYLARLGSCDSTPQTPASTDKSSWGQLLRDAEVLYDTYVNTSNASKLQSDRLYADPDAKAGDMVYEGAIYFLRDALNLEELFDAVKCGHSGRILSVLKLFALSFRGSDRPQYARALLRLIHNCEVVWPPKLRDLILQNWVVNPTGRPKAFVELDLVQEHLIYWIKRVYSAHGSNETWEWLTMITPCIAALRTLTNDVNEMIGNYRTTRHSSPDKMRDILKIIDSLEKYKVYEVQKGRTFDGKCDPVVDAQALGLAGLLWGNAPGLKEYNKVFKAKQKAYQGPDIAHTTPHTAFPRHPGAAASQSLSNDSGPKSSLGVDSMDVDWADSDSEGKSEDGDEAETTLNEEEALESLLPLENEEDVSLEVDAVDAWNMVHGLETEE